MKVLLADALSGLWPVLPRRARRWIVNVWLDELERRGLLAREHGRLRLTGKGAEAYYRGEIQ